MLTRAKTFQALRLHAKQLFRLEVFQGNGDFYVLTSFPPFHAAFEFISHEFWPGLCD